jgi:hypothetical protein
MLEREDELVSTVVAVACVSLGRDEDVLTTPNVLLLATPARDTAADIEATIDWLALIPVVLSDMASAVTVGSTIWVRDGWSTPWKQEWG